MDRKELNLDGILQSVMQNPEMLKSAMELAGKLSESGGLSSLFAPKEEAHVSVKSEESMALAPVTSEVRRANDMQRHRKLIEALSLYVSEEKRDMFDLILKLFDIMELANHVKR